MRPWNQATTSPLASSSLPTSVMDAHRSYVTPRFFKHRFDFVRRVFRPEVGVLHRLNGVAELMRGIGGRAERRAGIARRRLHKQFAALGTQPFDESLVGFYVQRHAARVAESFGARDVRRPR